MSGSKFYVANLDLSNILQPYSSGATTVTRFYSNNTDIGSIYQTYGGSGTKANATNFFVGANDLCNLFQKYGVTYVTSGLINYYNFQTSYSGSGASVTNLVNSSADMTLKNTPSYNNTTKTMLFSNSSGAQCMQSNSTLSNFQTVSIWYKQLAQTTSYFYLFDGRSTSGTTTTYILNPSGGGVGAFWNTMYIDGGASTSTTTHWSSAEFTNGTWHNLTFTSPSAPSQAGFLTFAGNRTITECANIEVAAVMVYNRAITQAENAQNCAYMKALYSPLGVGFP